jgi:Zn-dependent protease with chaperone function
MSNPFITPLPTEPSPFVVAPLPPAHTVYSTNGAVDYRDFIHPEDEVAKKQLISVPGLQIVAKRFMEIGYESAWHGFNMATKIRLSPTQLPELYNHLPPICQKFGIAEPEFYLEMNPAPNAYTYGDKRTFVVITSGLLSHVKNDEELIAVLAHECGHILCHHVLYKTMADLISSIAVVGGVLGGIGGVLMGPIELALKYWSRRSELSADRAELVYLGNSASVVGVLARLSGGPHAITGNINFEELVAQAQDYLDLQANSKWHRILQTLEIMFQSHPFSAVRVHEILKWEKSEQYLRLRATLHGTE